MTSRITRHEMMMQIAEVVAQRSMCQRLFKVGAVVTDAHQLQVLGIGYNGPPKGLPHTCRHEEKGNCGCVHAETNALLKAPYGRGTILYTTVSPCEACASLIINAGIEWVYYREEYRDKTPLLLLSRAGVKYWWLKDTQLEPPEIR